MSNFHRAAALLSLAACSCAAPAADSQRPEDGAVAVCRHLTRERLGSPSGLEWSPGSPPPTREPGDVWRVRVLYRAPGISPSFAWCHLKALPNDQWQRVPD